MRSKQASDILEDPSFRSCDSIFKQLREFAEAQVDQYQVQFRGALLQLAQEEGLPLEVDVSKFSVLKGIEGEFDFSTRSTTINQVTIKSVDPKRIMATIVKIKRALYDTPFEPQMFIDSLLQCYKEILKREGRGMGDVVPILQLYTDYVWSLQSKAFLQNMEKGKFRGYSVEQFAVDFWRFFKSNVSAAEGGYSVRLNPGRGKGLWMIEPNGEKRLIAHALFAKN